MTTIVLPARCDRAAASALLPEFVAAAGSDTLEIDASQVEQAGHAMLQLLASARKSIARARIVASPALGEAARLTGLEAHLFGEDAA
jgi:anti-anti-sigma regulatory factor